MAAFVWRDGYRPYSDKSDPQAVGRAIESLRRKSGLVTPEIVVDAARSEHSPLHNEFEWDDGVAAEQYRIAQAGYLIRAVVMVPSTDNHLVRPTRQFVYVTSPEGQRGYTNVQTAMSDSELQVQVLARALSELKAWRAKYAHLKELAAVFNAIDEAASVTA